MYIPTALKAAVKASSSIMDVYKGDFAAKYKADGSPVTIADKQADAIIRDQLQVTNIPVISEESSLLPFEERQTWSRLWLVDPLDGTKEFIKRNGEFTVNIALVENGKPVMGVITAPVSGKGWIGAPGLGIYVVNNIYDECLTADPEQFFSKLKAFVPSHSASQPESLRIATSRSHPEKQTQDLISYLKSLGTRVRRVPRGSSLKLCEIATGRADLYPRFGPTMEWDIAAGHALLNAVGGDVVNIQTGKPLTYNKPDMLNPYFIATNGDQTREMVSSIRKWHATPAFVSARDTKTPPP